MSCTEADTFYPPPFLPFPPQDGEIAEREGHPRHSFPNLSTRGRCSPALARPRSAALLRTARAAGTAASHPPGAETAEVAGARGIAGLGVPFLASEAELGVLLLALRVGLPLAAGATSGRALGVAALLGAALVAQLVLESHVKEIVGFVGLERGASTFLALCA